MPELRAIWLLIAYTAGCVFDWTLLEGVATDRCLAGGPYYAELCGPRPAFGFECFAQSSTLPLFAATYTKHREVDGWRAESVVDRMLKSMGGDAVEGSGRSGESMTAIKNAWLERAELGLDEEDWNAPLVRQMCREMRCGAAILPTPVDKDVGDTFADVFDSDTAEFHAARGLYEFCMQGEGLPTCKSPSLSEFAIENYELSTCLKNQPQCIRDREVCTGTCGGSETGLLMLQDVVTTMVKEEVYGLAQERLDNGRVNATVLKGTINVPMFDLSPAFRLFSARVRVRAASRPKRPPSPPDACDAKYCANNPLACAVVQRVLERAPTLTFVLGKGFRHRYATTVPPSPPPPPPSLLDYGLTELPPPLPPPPPSPPPWYAGAEACVPVITPAEAGIAGLIEVDVERSLCVYTRAVVSERVPASRCFRAESFSPAPPPPPPDEGEVQQALINTLLRHQRQIKGEDAQGADRAPDQSDAQQFQKEHEDQMQEAVDLLKTLANDNFQLRDILGDVEEKLHIGRRMAEDHFARGRGRELFPEDARSHSIVEQSLHGDAPLLGLTRAECTALCAAFGGNETTQFVCKATATRMLNPEDLTDTSVAACWLLRSTSGCEARDFAVQTYARRETLPCQLPTAFQNPLCIQLAPDRNDLKTMTFSMGADVCRNGRGRTAGEYPVLPQPQSSLEAMSMIAAVRQAGGTAFWAWTPKKNTERITTHWAGTDSHRLVVPVGNTRCILVGTVGPTLSSRKQCLRA